ncbi:hypothetical protein HHL23_18735 [Chryseobacterium sp. RP-3-3]|uniref:Uncharacterized protein n=1 Tax=Chryseobacterium antibioticum TaxID=2728847 RepID=A0A7Y0AQU6_9FLAO|nr:hypothetical protein [Chryseobacterium antibioticum]NML71816.1 hypothetical protein [Chryseobacterium antibioticum]
MSLIFIALDQPDNAVLLDDDMFLEKYTDTDFEGFYPFESIFMDKDNINNFLNFIFMERVDIHVIEEKNNKVLIDLSVYKSKFLDPDKLINVYFDWLSLSSRENMMSEYGNMICALGYLKRNSNKQNLYLIIE